METTIRIEIEKAIKAQKWDKYGFQYAISGMDVHSSYGTIFGDSYYKKEIIEKFWELCETRFYRIADFTTFRNNEVLQNFAKTQKSN